MGQEKNALKANTPFPHTCGNIDNDSHPIHMLGSKELSKPTGTIQNQKRNANNHGGANQIAQAEAIKFAARQSDNRTITRAAAQNT